MTIEERTLIAKFMGLRLGHPDPNEKRWKDHWFDADGQRVGELPYYMEWNSIMDVVEKIEKLSFKWPGREEDISVNVTIFYDSCQMLADDNDEILFFSYGVDGNGKQKSTVDCVLQFIQWYNQQPK